MAELEARYGFRSSWNFPLAQYRLDWPRLERLRAGGFFAPVVKCFAAFATGFASMPFVAIVSRRSEATNVGSL